MSEDRLTGRRIGWIGAGRMGFAMARRLLAAGCHVAVYNRTRAKAEPLAAHGADVVDSPAALADRDVVFTMLAGPDDFKRVVAGTGSDSNPWPVSAVRDTTTPVEISGGCPASGS